MAARRVSPLLVVMEDPPTDDDTGEIDRRWTDLAGWIGTHDEEIHGPRYAPDFRVYVNPNESNIEVHRVQRLVCRR